MGANNTKPDKTTMSAVTANVKKTANAPTAVTSNPSAKVVPTSPVAPKSPINRRDLNRLKANIPPSPTSPSIVMSAMGVEKSPPRSPPERFEISNEIIGEGAFSQIRLATSLKSGQKVAVKSFQKDRMKDEPDRAEDFRLICKERDILRKLTHPNIIRLYADHEDDKVIHLYLDYVEGGDLYTWVCGQGRLTEKTSRLLLKQMIDAVDYCHKSGFCHRDIKLENFLLDQKAMRVVLIDFGFASPIPQDRVFTDFPGSPAYACPSILLGQAYDGPSADVYALGVVLFTLHYSSYPFYHQDLITMCRMICDVQLTLPVKVPATPPLRDLLRWMMQKQSANRPTIPEIRKHPWITQGESAPMSPLKKTKKLAQALLGSPRKLI
eukprot:TRINITY_DN17765_c0_g1_i1.p1 TRINITY_DN17765_c0_g1~~TRINITY_DN17765_c0_g1_i1.p1  ORF type:complete len:397 (+),score=62.95 TRINITY_DN17765_c0_g1_i1:53-1192(+)